VLIVHHDQSEAARLDAAFAARGYAVEIARTGTDALRAWRDHHPDVAVIDDRLPDLSAERLLAAIKKPGSRTVAFTIISNPAAHTALSVARQGADGSLLAPVDAARLLSLCETVRRQRALLRVEELLEERSRALRDSEARWRLLFEAIPDIVVVHDEAGIIRHINQTGADQLEWSAHDLIGRSLTELERRERPRLTEDDLAAARASSVYVTRSGREIPVEVNRRRIAFEGQAAVLSVARDVSARRELERQRRSFLAMLTNDIKDPLAIAQGFGARLGEIGELNEQQRDLVTRIEANAGTVLTRVANYLNLTQIETGQLTLSRRPVAIGTLLESVAAQYVDQSARQGIGLRCEIEESLGLIAADATALERALGNLLHNAIKFTQGAGQIVCSASRRDDAVVIRISDTGIGIAPEDLPTIFQPYRAAAIRPAGEGGGFGLFIAQSLVQAHGGRIEVESRPRQGTTFTVWLPTELPSETQTAFTV
jgi:PAS domain S-box-containing protein